jgi:hypothetical protein
MSHCRSSYKAWKRAGLRFVQTITYDQDVIPAWELQMDYLAGIDLGANLKCVIYDLAGDYCQRHTSTER